MNWGMKEEKCDFITVSHVDPKNSKFMRIAFPLHLLPHPSYAPDLEPN